MGGRTSTAHLPHHHQFLHPFAVAMACDKLHDLMASLYKLTEHILTQQPAQCQLTTNSAHVSLTWHRKELHAFPQNVQPEILESLCALCLPIAADLLPHLSVVAARLLNPALNTESFQAAGAGLQQSVTPEVTSPDDGTCEILL